MRNELELEEKVSLVKALRKRDIALARRSLLHFILQIKPGYKINFHHFLVCERLSTLLDNPGQRLIITIPPQYGKSEIVSRFLPAWILGNFIDGKIIQASYGASLAEGFNRDVQRIMETAMYRKIFPKTVISPFAPRLKRTEQVVETSGGGYLYSVGVGGSTTGRTANPLLIVDDPFKDLEEAMSPTHREYVHDWFSSVAQTRLSLNASVIVMHTRWHADDLAGWLLDKAKKDAKATQWEILNFPAVASDLSDLHPDDPRLPGEALWPDMKGDEDVMDTIKHDVGSRIWASVFQQKPAAEGGNMVKDSWWRFYREIPDLDDLDELIISVDCAFKDLKDSDFVVIQCWGRIGAKKYLLHQIRDRMDVIKTIQMIVQMALRYPRAHAKLVEDKANGPAVMQLLEGKMSGVVAITPQGSRISRVTAVSPQIEAGNVFLPHKDIASFDVTAFVSEFTEFPKGKNDDQVDAATQALDRLSRDENHYLRKLLSKKD